MDSRGAGSVLVGYDSLQTLCQFNELVNQQILYAISLYEYISFHVGIWDLST